MSDLFALCSYIKVRWCVAMAAIIITLNCSRILSQFKNEWWGLSKDQMIILSNISTGAY